MFVPRRILYELRAARAWFAEKERCVFCDILRQEEQQGKRMVDTQGEYVAFCPYASRVPFETWIMWRKHNHLFEQPRSGANRTQSGGAAGQGASAAWRKFPSPTIWCCTPRPTPFSRKAELSPYWQTIADDFHWHIEILPIVEQRSKSYSIKEIYFNALLPEQAAEKLRQLDPNA